MTGFAEVLRWSALVMFSCVVPLGIFLGATTFAPSDANSPRPGAAVQFCQPGQRGAIDHPLFRAREIQVRSRGQSRA